MGVSQTRALGTPVVHGGDMSTRKLCGAPFPDSFANVLQLPRVFPMTGTFRRVVIRHYQAGLITQAFFWRMALRRGHPKHKNRINAKSKISRKRRRPYTPKRKGLKTDRSFPKLGVPFSRSIRAIVFWGPLKLGNYQTEPESEL